MGLGLCFLLANMGMGFHGFFSQLVDLAFSLGPARSQWNNCHQFITVSFLMSRLLECVEVNVVVFFYSMSCLLKRPCKKAGNPDSLCPWFSSYVVVRSSGVKVNPLQVTRCVYVMPIYPSLQSQESHVLLKGIVRDSTVFAFECIIKTRGSMLCHPLLELFRLA